MYIRLNDSDAALQPCEKITLCAAGRVFEITEARNTVLQIEEVVTDGDGSVRRVHQGLGPYFVSWKE